MCGALLGCSTSGGPKAEVDKGAVDEYRSSGYAYRPDAGVTMRRVNAPVTQPPWTFSLAQAPGPAASRPVIVYLPPLGNADNATCRWLDLWARAGYAVVTIQPLEDDANIWTTAEARSGDFERVARARFTDDLMADRIARLARLLSQVRARSAAGEPGLAGLDWTRVALAGADLGAYTVQSIAAMPADQLAAIGWPVNPAALLVISPFARQTTRANQAPLPHPPTLMVSARDDIDAYGVITDVSLRHLAFDRLGTGDDYFFELGTASHRWLGGVTGSSSSTEVTGRRISGFEDEAPNRRGRGTHGNAHDGVAPMGDDEDLPPDASAKLAATRAERDAQAAKARSRQLTHAAKSEVGFEDISIAFFDAYLRQDARAHSWLLTSASAWLQDGDRLKHR
jgi:hypothetical protein